MYKIIFTFVFCLITVSIFAQSNTSPQRLKYKVFAPDGSVAITIIDDSINDSMKLESATNFYKYQLVDINTDETVFSSSNRGRACAFNKSKVAEGTYNLRLFTKNFIITSEIKVMTSPVNTMASNTVAMRN